MADWLPPKWPDNYQKHIDRPAYIETAKKLWVWPEMWEVVYNTQKWFATIFVKWEAKKETGELNEILKKEFIEKLKKLPDYQWSKVQEAIEKWTIEIKKIPNRNWYAIYESKTWNLIYLTKLDGSWYSNVDYFRKREFMWDLFQAGYIRKWYWKIELDNKTWLWELYKKDWKKVPIFSDEYATATLNAINEMMDLAYEMKEYIDEIKKKRGKN